MDDFADNWYLTIGHWIGALAASLTFLGSWWYCAATYGYLFGFGLGWLPSLILSAISGLAVKFLWGPSLLAGAAFAAGAFN